jgi:capsular polysaccharide biosynthesis protein
MQRNGIDRDHATATGRRPRLRDLGKWWPLIFATTLITLSTSMWSYSHTAPTYTATARIVVVPLPQWDETFLGTDLIRDSGDAARTAATVAADLGSDHYARVTAQYLGNEWTAESVRTGLTVKAPGETNIVEVTAKSSDPNIAQKLASGFVAATAADRWQTISAQLDSRIAALKADTLTAAGDQQGANPSASEQLARLQTLAVVRGSGVDPTLQTGATDPSVAAAQLPLAATLVLAALGGVFIGTLAAAGIEVLQRKRRSTSFTNSAVARAVSHSSNGTNHVDTKSR